MCTKLFLYIHKKIFVYTQYANTKIKKNKFLVEDFLAGN